MSKKMALGRGLGALIEDASTENRGHDAPQKQVTSELVKEIEVSKIDLNPFQPRTNFNEDALSELAESIKKIGIIQPITVRAVDDDRFQLIAGERRLRASKIAGLTTIPAYIRTADDQGLLEMGLIENIQREDLNAIEVAISYQRLIDECNLTQENLSDRVGKKRATISNYLRLLKLSAEVQKALIDGLIDMGHARALITIDDANLQTSILKKIIEEDLSVRKTEELVRLATSNDKKTSTKKTTKTSLGTSEEYIKSHLVDSMGLRADVKPGKKGDGRIIISYNNPEELEMIVEKFDKFKE